SGLTSGRAPINWTWDPSSQTLTGYIGTIGQANYVPVMTVVLSAPVSGNDWTYNVTLTAPLDHPNTNSEDELALNIGITVTDGNGGSTTGSFGVTVEDDQPEAENDDNHVDVVVDSFTFSGVAAEWKNVQGGTSVNKFDSNDNDTALDQVRWGKPSSSNGQQSGYGFIDNDAALSGALPLNQEIVLGTFTHFNFPIESGTSIKAATMEVSFTVTDAYGKTTPVKLALNFSHNETPNSGADPRDIVTVGQTNVTFNYEGQVYTLQVIGFKDANGNVVSSIYTNENAATSYQLVVRMVAGNGYTLPNAKGDVLDNDSAGADSALEIIGVAKGDVTNSGALGQVGATITGLYGTLVLKANGEYQYQVTKNANEIPNNAVETFTYTIRDGDGDTSSAILNINVNTVDANGVPLVDVKNITTKGSGVNDDFIVAQGENGSNQKQLNVNFGGNSAGVITNQDGNDVITTGANLTSHSKTDSQVVSSGEGNDHIETGKGDDVIYAGKTGAANYASDAELELSVNTLASHHIMTGALTGSDKIVDKDGLLLSQDVASQKADVVNGGSGNDRIYGQSGSDILYGHTGNDHIDGGNHNDGLRGGAGDDTLIGGLGDDVLRGDTGADTFVWRYADADKGTDHIMDFNVREDKLDLSDLLQGETADTLENYLYFSLDKGSTIIDIDANKDGVFDQHIVLDGVDLYRQYGAVDNAGIINGLLGSNGNGPLIIDTQPVTPEPAPGMPPLDHEFNKIP
ncbi:MAG: choice-of-anchor K domain-containing protein, partial [Shewanella sp.]